MAGISGSGSSLLPTPLSRDARAGSRLQKSKRGKSLVEVTQLLPTPLTGDWRGGIGGNGQSNLRAYINYNLIQTPLTRDWKGKTQKGKYKIINSIPDMFLFSTPQARDFRVGEEDRFINPSRSRNLNDQVAKKGNGKVCPQFYEYIMGYPQHYTDLFNANGDVPDWAGGTFEMPYPLTDTKKHRVPRIKALGNAVVPQIPFLFFQIIKEIEGLNE
jgi:hypothetical protein